MHNRKKEADKAKQALANTSNKNFSKNDQIENTKPTKSTSSKEPNCITFFIFLFYWKGYWNLELQLFKILFCFQFKWCHN